MLIKDTAPNFQNLRCALFDHGQILTACGLLPVTFENPLRDIFDLVDSETSGINVLTSTKGRPQQKKTSPSRVINDQKMLVKRFLGFI
ncbi:hypothetical protein CEXT_690691 [Caerostris extrusa]|uniref:Uncharacterized protein n=1 Tax=Caerostris extrusa TaxID=172846 RepID=A0AAV4SVR2_CAEEX|nr:hypothetical protein CEXT_690691 [Caerostris extrusa]